MTRPADLELISRLPELVEPERDRKKVRSRLKPQPLRFKPVTIGDLIREGKLLEVHCGNCRPERHLYLNPDILRLPKRMPVPEAKSFFTNIGVVMSCDVERRGNRPQPH
jgi:hypothetical protein